MSRRFGCLLELAYVIAVVVVIGVLLLALAGFFATPRAAAEPPVSTSAGDPVRPLLGAPQRAAGRDRDVVASGAPLVISGPATWYNAPTARDAAAGPALRRALGRGWRDSTVEVCAGSRCIETVLSDWCACGHGHLIDLDDQAFRQLAPLSAGVVHVRVFIAGTARPTPPPTDVSP